MIVFCVQVFARGPTLYAFKGLAGRYAPIGVHIALLLVMGGATISAIGGYHGTVMVPQGLGFEVGDVLAPKGILSLPSPVMNRQVQINKFFIDYLDTGAVCISFFLSLQSAFHASSNDYVRFRNEELFSKLRICRNNWQFYHFVLRNSKYNWRLSRTTCYFYFHFVEEY